MSYWPNSPAVKYWLAEQMLTSQKIFKKKSKLEFCSVHISRPICMYLRHLKPLEFLIFILIMENFDYYWWYPGNLIWSVGKSQTGYRVGKERDLLLWYVALEKRRGSILCLWKHFSLATKFFFLFEFVFLSLCYFNNNVKLCYYQLVNVVWLYYWQTIHI